MKINKNQEQSLSFIVLLLKKSISSHVQLYVVDQEYETIVISKSRYEIQMIYCALKVGERENTKFHTIENPKFQA